MTIFSSLLVSRDFVADPGRQRESAVAVSDGLDVCLAHENRPSFKTGKRSVSDPSGQRRPDVLDVRVRLNTAPEQV